MNITSSQKRAIEQFVNVFETGTPDGNYSQVVVYPDAPGGAKQITYGRSQLTEHSGNLRKLLEDYDGVYAQELKAFIPKLRGNLHENGEFKSLLRLAGKDAKMQLCQDRLFDERYYAPAFAWASKYGFKDALSLLVIYDSFVHSGRMRDSLLAKVEERLPCDDGDEHDWIELYVHERRNWLANHSNELLQRTVYRMDEIRKQIDLGNWDLMQRPIQVRGCWIR